MRQFVCEFTTNAGTPVTMKQNNPTQESIAEFFEVDASDVDFIELDYYEIVTVKGEKVGRIVYIED